MSRSIFDPQVPAGAYDAFYADGAARSAGQRRWAPSDGALPALYIGHGAPPLLDDAEWMSQLSAWALSMPKPRAVLIVSAHWEVASLMPDGSPAHQHPSRGLDHGAWVPLKVMYPLADVPVLQLSLPTSDPAALLSLGARLRPLRESGALVIGSGFLTHGLPFLTPAAFTDGAVPGWSAEFDQWAASALGRGDVAELSRYRGAPGMPYAHPSADHFLPLFVTLGAASNPEAPVRTVIDGYWMGLAKRSFQVA